MDKITLTEYLLALAGLSIIWLSHLHKSRMKTREAFSWRKYFNSNWILILTCLISTLCLLHITDFIIDLGLGWFGTPKETERGDLDNAIAFIGGLVNLKLVDFVKAKVLDKIKTR
jgi:amino acid transporter